MQAIGYMREQKAAGDAAFREERYDEAFDRYTAALEEDSEHVPILCNRSLTALKLGRAEVALRDAQAALDVLAQPGPVPPPLGQLAKAFHRKAEALLGMGQLLESIHTYKQGLSACPGCTELHAALRLAAEQLPVVWLAKYFVPLIEAAQAPNPLSSRDGRLIKPVPPELRLEPDQLQAHLEAALYPLQDEARDLLCEAWARASKPGKAEAAFLRGAAYLRAGNAQQALKDARFALVYGPQLDSGPVGVLVPATPSPAAGIGANFGRTSSTTSSAASSSLVAASGHAAAGASSTGPPPPPPALPQAPGHASAWPAALALQSAALEALADNVPAALSMMRAHELDPGNEEYEIALERLLRRIPEQMAQVLQAGGSAALEAHLAAEREAGLPEFLRQRPKYYYYNEWMKKRINKQYPELPGEVMEKLLGMEANELDLILQYPRATQITVERLLDVYREQGPEALQSFAVPLLSWEQYKAIKEENAPLEALLPSTSTQAQQALPCQEGSAGGSIAGTAGGGNGLFKGAGAATEAGAGGAAGCEDASRSKPPGASSNSSGGSGAHGAGPALGGHSSAGSQLDGASCTAAGAGDDAASEAGSGDIDELCQLD